MSDDFVKNWLPNIAVSALFSIPLFVYNDGLIVAILVLLILVYSLSDIFVFKDPFPFKNLTPPRVAVICGLLFLYAFHYASKTVNINYKLGYNQEVLDYVSIWVGVLSSLFVFIGAIFHYQRFAIITNAGAVRCDFHSAARCQDIFKTNFEKFNAWLRDEEIAKESKHKIFEKLQSWVDREEIALTATCMPFKCNSDGTFELVLIKNSNFNDFWLAPGGHVDLLNNQQEPSDVAIEKTYSEAGINVELLSPSIPLTDDFANCKLYKAPHNIYYLEIDKDSKCSKSKSHRYHLDFTYTGIFRDNPSGVGRFERIFVPLQKGYTSNDIETSIRKRINEHYKHYRQKIPTALPFPNDFPSRVEAAMKILP